MGTAIAVALLTFAITFFLMRKKNEKRMRAYTQSMEDARGIGGAEKPAEAVVRKDSSKFDKFIQPSLDDDSIRSAAFGFIDKIDTHVSNFYRNSKTPISQETIDALAPIASQRLMTEGPQIVQYAQTRDAIAFCIAELATSRISSHGEPSQSLLPLDLPLFSGVRDTSSKDTQQALYWSRIFGAYLYRSGEPGYVAQRSRTINELVTVISGTFAYWQSNQYSEDERLRSLGRIFEDAAEVGILLYSQPSAFEFSWSPNNKTPALLKTADEKGRKIAQPQRIVEPTSLGG